MGTCQCRRLRPGDPHSGEFAFSGVTPLGPLLASHDSLIVPQGNNSPAAYSKQTGALLRFTPVSVGSTWATIDGNFSYTFAGYRSGLELFGCAVIDAGVKNQVVRFTAADLPQISPLATRLPSEAHEQGKVSVIIADGKLYAR